MATTSSNPMHSSYNRPKLLRSCVTAPTVVTSYASRKDRSSPTFGDSSVHSSSRDRATTILNRVASYSYGCSEKSEERRKQIADRRNASGPPVGRRGIHEKGGNGENKKAKISVQVQSDGGKHGYFSFPSFEEFEGYSEKEESNSRDSVARRHTHR